MMLTLQILYFTLVVVVVVVVVVVMVIMIPLRRTPRRVAS